MQTWSLARFHNDCPSNFVLSWEWARIQQAYKYGLRFTLYGTTFFVNLKTTDDEFELKIFLVVLKWTEILRQLWLVHHSRQVCQNLWYSLFNKYGIFCGRSTTSDLSRGADPTNHRCFSKSVKKFGRQCWNR